MGRFERDRRTACVTLGLWRGRMECFPGNEIESSERHWAWTQHPPFVAHAGPELTDREPLVYLAILISGPHSRLSLWSLSTGLRSRIHWTQTCVNHQPAIKEMSKFPAACETRPASRGSGQCTQARDTIARVRGCDGARHATLSKEKPAHKEQDRNANVPEGNLLMTAVSARHQRSSHPSLCSARTNLKPLFQ